METNNMKIGEVRAIQGLGDITCVKGEFCDLCAFHYQSGCRNASEVAGECMADGREDCENVYFPFYKDDELCED